MTNGWNGIDPSMPSTGGTDLELASRFTVHADITVTGIRVWSSISTTIAGRNATFWTSTGTLIQTVDIDDTSGTSGWKTYNLGTPLHYVAGDRFDLSHSNHNFYPEVNAANAAFPKDSSDAAVTVAYSHYGTTLALYPNNASDTFYGIDIVYTNNTPAVNVAPTITGMLVTTNGLLATAAVNITDETPASVTVKWEWGDGSSDTTGAGVTSKTHTYAVGGTYAVLATATDAQGAQDSEAKSITLSVSLTTAANEEWIDDIFDAVISDVQRSGYFDKVNGHEPKKAPNYGLTAAVWVQAIDPMPLLSGLASTSGRIVFMVRIYSNMLKEPQDAIDPAVMKAVSNIMRRYHDDFDFEGAIRNIDLLGAFGIALAGQAGYLEIDKKEFRIFDITVPCLIDDVWPQVN